jgi:hypothetical protein
MIKTGSHIGAYLRLWKWRARDVPFVGATDVAQHFERAVVVYDFVPFVQYDTVP